MEALKHDPFDVRDEELDELFAEHEAQRADDSGDFYPIEVHDVRDELEAERHLESMQRVQRDIDKLAAHRDAMIKRAEDWYDERSSSLSNRTAWHLDGLRNYLSLTGKKTLKLIGGVIKTRAGSEKTIVDDEKFMEWAILNGYDNLITTKTTHAPKKAEIKKWVNEGGTIPPGVSFEKSDASFKVELT